MTAPFRHSGLPEGVDRFGLLKAFERVARPYFGLSHTDIALVRHNIMRTFDQDYSSGQICASWQMVCNTAIELNVSSRSINAAERKLEAMGFLHRDFASNGARSGARQDGNIIWANGINLGPLIDRYSELVTAAEVLSLRRKATTACRTEIRNLNRVIRSSGNEGLKARSQEILPKGRSARITNLEQLDSIRAALGAVVAELESYSRALHASGPSEDFGAPIIQTKTIQESRSATRSSPVRELRITTRLAMDLATTEYRDTLLHFGEPSWPNIVEASSSIAASLGISSKAWKLACVSLGREMAALCVIVIHRNAALPEHHSYHAKSPGGCLVGMTEKLPRRANLTGMVRAIQGELSHE
jgi:replication initiation protein RepC